MFIPNKLRRSSCFEEKLLGVKDHGGGLEQLQIRLVKSRPDAPENLEFRQWERGEGNERVPTKHGLRVPLSIVPWIVGILQKINPAAANDEQPENKE